MGQPEVAFVRTTEADVEGAVQRVGVALSARGFAVIATLRLHELLREKLGREIPPVVILEVCSPRYALKSLEANRDAALLLPCKIVVSLEHGRTRVALQRPTVALGRLLPVPELSPVGVEVERLLAEAIDEAVRTSPAPATSAPAGSVPGPPPPSRP